jgi:hypothetical protein
VQAMGGVKVELLGDKHMFSLPGSLACLLFNRFK